MQIPLTTNYEWLDMFTHAKYNDAKWTHRDYDHDQIMNVFDYWIFGNADNSGTPVQKNPETGAWEAVPGAGVVTRDGLIGALMRGETLTLNSNGAIKRWEPNNYLLDALYGNADTWKHNVSIAGGDAKFNYRASANYSTAQSQLLQSCFYNLSLLFYIVRSARIRTHRNKRSYRTRSTGLTNNRWKSCNNNGRNSSFFNRSLHQYCRAVAGTSASGEDYCVNFLFFEHLCNGRTSLAFELLLVSAAAHESCMYRRTSLDKAFFCQLMDSVDREHTVNVLINITVIISTV